MPLTSVRLACEAALTGQTELLVVVQDYLLPLVPLGPRRAHRVGGRRLVALWQEVAALRGVGLDLYTPAAILAGIHADGEAFIQRLVKAETTSQCWTRVAYQAARANDLGVLQRIYSTLQALEKTLQAPLALEIAAVSGDVALVQWFHAHGIGVATPRTLPRAAARGDLAVVQWLVRETPRLPDHDTILRLAMDECARCGHLDVLQWLCRQSCSVWWSTGALAAALRNGHCELAAWIHANNEERMLSYAYGTYDPSLPDPDLRAEALEAFARGDLRVLDWLRERGWLRRVTNSHTQRARRAGHVHVLDYVETHFPDYKRSIFQFRAGDAVGGSVAAAQWALDRGLLENSLRAVTTAARRGHVAFMRWYVGVFGGELERPKYEDDDALAVAIARGYLECAVFLVEKELVSVTQSAIEQASQRGYAELAQWMRAKYGYESFD